MWAESTLASNKRNCYSSGLLLGGKAKLSYNLYELENTGGFRGEVYNRRRVSFEGRGDPGRE
jgi:hypothetical protein